jgi:uncharacterized protein with beta-barrel porin domain
VRPELRVAWTHEFADVTPSAGERFAQIPQLPFTIGGTDPGHDAALIGAAVTVAPRAGLSLYARYDALVSARLTQHAISAGLKLIW